MWTLFGVDMKLSEEKIAGFRNFANKLWNIGRFVLHANPAAKPTWSAPKPKTAAGTPGVAAVS
jgi:valyl-tRNA synthetase